MEEIYRKIFSAHFGQLSIIFLWLSGMYFHGARFSNYKAWLSDPTHIRPSAQVVWPIVRLEILNGYVGEGFRGIQITSDFFRFGARSAALTLGPHPEKNELAQSTPRANSVQSKKRVKILFHKKRGKPMKKKSIGPILNKKRVWPN
ncbi:hypothetical protein RDABS01_014552 [Bienertia sinuspersici]